MSLRHLKSTITTSCLVVAAAVSATSAIASQSGLSSPGMIQATKNESEVTFRGSGRVSDEEHIAYRASGRFNSGFESYISYRGSERGVTSLAYRASGRFSSGFGNFSQLSNLLETDEQTVAYRASGRFDSGFGQYVMSYRGSERGIDTLA